MSVKQREVRGGIPAEIRADESGVKVSGYAAVFSQEADIGGYFREVIAPGAFKAAIERDDVPFLIEHEGLPLARTR
ncbi:MAG: HK97 family phage prohead protease, partial [Rhizobiales bacterium]|nr:HK97 family phage prohead protease [Hyphomicrobiales bacterium]